MWSTWCYPSFFVLCLAKLTRNFILDILFAWSRSYFSIILIIVKLHSNHVRHCWNFLQSGVIRQCRNEISVQQQFNEWVVMVQEPKLLKFILGYLVPVPFFEQCLLSSNHNIAIFLRSSFMYRYFFSVLTGMADHLQFFFIEIPLISVVKEQNNMLDYEIY